MKITSLSLMMIAGFLTACTPPLEEKSDLDADHPKPTPAETQAVKSTQWQENLGDKAWILVLSASNPLNEKTLKSLQNSPDWSAADVGVILLGDDESSEVAAKLDPGMTKLTVDVLPGGLPGLRQLPALFQKQDQTYQLHAAGLDLKPVL